MSMVDHRVRREGCVDVPYKFTRLTSVLDKRKKTNKKFT